MEKQMSFTDYEYSLRKRKTKREEFLECMDEIMPWDEIVAIIEPYYYNKVGRKARDIETMFRMFLLQRWYSLSEEAVEDSIYDSYAMRKFMHLNFVEDSVPDGIINNPSRLSDEDYEIMKKHPVMGAKILSNIKEMPDLSIGARWHHEKYNGKGYPDGIAGENIPEQARIIAVADAYDAMTSYRSYREPMPQEKVKEEFEKNSGTQFDPRFAGIMLEMINEDKNYDMREKK